MKLEKFLLEHKTKTITEKELREAVDGTYEEIVIKVKQSVEDNLLSPVIASGTNGRRPSLYNKYRKVTPKKDYSNIIEQIKLLHPRFDHQAYFDNPKLYIKYKKEIEDLSSFLWRHSEELEMPMSINERSLKIWGREKLLKENFGLLSSVFKFKDWSLLKLNFYETPEPFFEYINKKSNEMNVLVIENKDTWYTLRRVMIEQNSGFLLGREYNVLIYGEGRKITRGKGKLEEYDREMLAGSTNTYYYFGDLDFDGISIFLDLVKVNENIEIIPCTELYCLMLSEADRIELPPSKNGRDNVDVAKFTSLLTPEADEKIRRILENGEYIPQEIINYQVFTQLMKLKQ